MNSPMHFDVVIIGSGIAGALVAFRLGQAGKKVLILEAGAGISANNNEEMQRFYTAAAKVPESPYTPAIFESNSTSPSPFINPTTVAAGRPSVVMTSGGTWSDPTKSYLIQEGPKAFASGYERVAGGTARHWMGTSLRLLPRDFRMSSAYGLGQGDTQGFVDWPTDVNYEQLEPWYQSAEREIGVSANVSEQKNDRLGLAFKDPAYQYPMPGIPLSVTDLAFKKVLSKVAVPDVPPLFVTPTPQARNSRPFRQRRACAGNTNCIPICPIQAKYDPTITLRDAINTGNVTILFNSVAYNLVLAAGSGSHRPVERVEFITYSAERKNSGTDGSATAKVFVVAANAIESPRLLQISRQRQGIEDPKSPVLGGPLVGKHLMDHPFYVAWALLPPDAGAENANKVWPYRGPLATGGIEDCRDGDFRRRRAAFRIEIANDGWAMLGDPNLTVQDFVTGSNTTRLNVGGKRLFGRALVQQLNSVLTRQIRLGFLIEQSPEARNFVDLASGATDGLGLPRPRIHYDLSPYTLSGLLKAKETATAIFAAMGAKEFTDFTSDFNEDERKRDGRAFKIQLSGVEQILKYYGSGHIMGTCRMGRTASDSVVDSNLCSWEHRNLYITGSSVFPTVGTANPTLTIAALSLRLADRIKSTPELQATKT